MNDGHTPTHFSFPTDRLKKGTCFYFLPVIAVDGFEVQKVLCRFMWHFPLDRQKQQSLFS